MILYGSCTNGTYRINRTLFCGQNHFRGIYSKNNNNNQKPNSTEFSLILVVSKEAIQWKSRALDSN